MQSSEQQDRVISFSKQDLGKPFQEKIIQALLLDRPWASQVSEVLNVNYFDYIPIKLVANQYLNYYKKYKEFPSFEILTTLIVEELKSPKEVLAKDQVLELLKKIKRNEDLGDMGYVKERTLEFCKKQALKIAIEESIDLINTDKYESIADKIKKAITLGMVQTSGLSLEKDIDARYSETYRRTIPTGITALDDRKILNGGSGAGELHIVIAASGVGKSQILVHIGAQALLQGKNVLHYTFELRERNVGIRYDSHLLDIDSLECFEHREQIKQFYAGNADKLGRLRIKEYKTGAATVNTIKAHMERLSLEGFIPDLLIIDYAGIMRSTERYELQRMELKKVYEELRDLAMELDIPVWSACQSNKEGITSDVVDLSNMAEAYSQAHICDFVLGLGRKSEEKSTGYGKLFIAKNRAGVDGISYRVHLDTARSKLRILTEEEVDSAELNEELQSEQFKTRIRKTFKEISAKHVGARENFKLDKINE